MRRLERWVEDALIYMLMGVGYGLIGVGFVGLALTLICIAFFFPVAIVFALWDALHG